MTSVETGYEHLDYTDVVLCGRCPEADILDGLIAKQFAVHFFW